MMRITLITIIFILSFIDIITFGLDILYKIRRKVKRHKIGIFQSSDIWKAKIKKITLKWLFETPIVPRLDNERLIILDIASGLYKSSTIQSWQRAGLLLGLSENSKDFSENVLIKKFINININSNNGEWFNEPTEIDSAMLAYSILKNSDEPMKIKPAMDFMVDLIFDKIGKDGTVMYRNIISTMRLVDTLGFICPFLALYGEIYNREDCILLAINCIETYSINGLDKETSIPCHAYDVDTHTPLGVFGWGRGVGWYTIALVDTYQILKYNIEYEVIIKLHINKIAKTLLDYQQKDGGFASNIILLSLYDSSTTSMLGYFFSICYEITGERKYLDAAIKCRNKLMTTTRKNGEVDFAQGDTKDIGVYSQKFDILPFAQGITLRLAEKLEALERLE